MKWIKFFPILLALTGCVTYPKVRINIIHDYVFQEGLKACEPFQGLHYIVAQTTIESEGDKDNKTYPCYEEIKFRCQDGSLHFFDDGGRYCFIQEAQLDETIKNIQYPK